MPASRVDATLRREIEAECMALSHAWAYHIDHKQYDELAQLFVPDGVFIRRWVPELARVPLVREGGRWYYLDGDLK